MLRNWMCVIGFVAVSSLLSARGGTLQNADFEIDFGSRENMNMWGEFGEAWGETYQVNAGQNDYIKTARSGNRMLLINVPVNTWNGLWQQVRWQENRAFAWEAYYRIEDGNLPANCATFMKVEFYDGMDQCVGSLEGQRRTEDTKGAWIRDELKGVTPAGTTAIRFILIAGHNPDGPGVLNKIYWDDASTLETTDP